MKSLAEMQEEVHTVNVDKGWFEDDRTFGDEIALLHSEASEALEAYRDHKFDELVRYSSDDGYSITGRGSLNDSNWRQAGLVGKPEGVPSELADVLIRLLDTCWRHDIDLEDAYEQKIAFNRTRPHRHGGRVL